MNDTPIEVIITKSKRAYARKTLENGYSHFVQVRRTPDGWWRWYGPSYRKCPVGIRVSWALWFGTEVAS